MVQDRYKLLNHGKALNFDNSGLYYLNFVFTLHKKLCVKSCNLC